MPNIITVQDKEYYNITQVGTDSTTGPTTTLLISPNEGYSINSTQFTGVDVDGVYTVSFVDTIGVNAPANEVNLIVTWAGAQNVDANTTYNVEITFDDTFESFSSDIIDLSFTVQASGSINWLNTTLKVINIEGVIPAASIENVANANTIFNVEKTLYSYEQTNMVCVEVETTEGLYYYEPGGFHSITIENAVGLFELLQVEEVLDNYGYCYKKKYYLAYTGNEAIEENDDIVITVHPPALITYFANFELDSVHYGPTTQEEKQLVISTNIPTGSWQLSFADVWANAGETAVTSSGTDDFGNTYYTMYIDLDSLPSLDPRTQTVSLKDQIYSYIVRDTISVTQSVAMAISMHIKSSPPGEYVIGDTPPDFVTTQAAKVIGRPNLVENAFEEGFDGVQTYYQVPYYGGVDPLVYELILNISNPGVAVTQELLNTGDYFQFSQIPEFFPVASLPPSEDYKNSSFIDFAGFLWEFVTGGENDSTTQFRRYFHIRNQDAFDHNGIAIDPGAFGSTDRTATMTMIHPYDNALSSTVTVEQHERRYDGAPVYISTIDSAGNTNTGLTVSGVSTVGTDDTSTYGSDISIPGGVGGIRLRIDQNITPGSVAWPQGTFNTFNQITTDETEADTFKQYPRPVCLVQYGAVFYGELNKPDGAAQLVGEDSSYTEVGEIEYNSNYNIAIAAEQHQYEKTIQFNSENNSFSDRRITFWLFHSQNEHVTGFNFDHNAKLTIVHEAKDKLQAYIWPVESDTYDTLESAYIMPEGEVRNINLDFNTTTPGIVPTFGLWDQETQVYTPMTTSVAIDGFFFNGLNATAIYNANGGYQYKLNAGFTENAVGAPNRNATLGFWHSTATPGVDPPTDTVSFFQPGAYADPNIYFVTGVVDGSSIQSGEAGSVTFNITVSDYDADDFANAENLPDIQLVVLDFPNTSGNLIANDGSIVPTTASLEVVANANFAVDGFTHTVTVNHNENTTGSQFHFGLKIKHQYMAAFDNNDTIFCTLQATEAIYFGRATWLSQDGSFSEELYLEDEEDKTITVPNNADQLVLEIRTNLGGEAEDDNSGAYYLPIDYIVARWVTGNNKVFSNGSNEASTNNNQGQAYDIPHSFYMNKGLGDNSVPLSQENSAHVIKSPSKSESGWNHLTQTNGGYPSVGDINWTSFGAWPNVNYNVTLNVSKNTTGYDTEQFIAIWTGDKSPKTNLVDVSQAFFQDNADTAGSISGTESGKNLLNIRAGAVQGIDDSLPSNALDYVNLVQDFTNNIEFVGKDKIKWNQNGELLASGTNASYTLFNGDGCPVSWNKKNYGLINLGIMQPTNPTDATPTFDATSNNSYGSGKILGISFDVEDYECITPEDPIDVGIASGYYNLPAFAPGSVESEEIHQEFEDYGGELGEVVPGDHVQMLSKIRKTGNGHCEGKIRINSGLPNFMNGIRFFVRSGVKCTFANIKVWEIDDESVLKPGSGLNYKVDLQTSIADSERSPNDVIKIVHAPFEASLSFAHDQIFGGAVQDPGVEIISNSVVDGTDFLTSIDGVGLFTLHTQGIAANTPVIRVWDGANSYAVNTSVDQPYNAFLSWAIVILDANPDENGERTFSFIVTEDNPFGTSRQVRLGIFDGEPALDITAPLDTYFISQTPDPNAP